MPSKLNSIAILQNFRIWKNVLRQPWGIMRKWKNRCLWATFRFFRMIQAILCLRKGFRHGPYCFFRTSCNARRMICGSPPVFPLSSGFGDELDMEHVLEINCIPIQKTIDDDTRFWQESIMAYLSQLQTAPWPSAVKTFEPPSSDYAWENAVSVKGFIIPNQSAGCASSKNGGMTNPSECRTQTKSATPLSYVSPRSEQRLAIVTCQPSTPQPHQDQGNAIFPNRVSPGECRQYGFDEAARRPVLLSGPCAGSDGFSLPLRMMRNRRREMR